jgi:hypothetical protein
MDAVASGMLACRTRTLTADGEVVWSWRRDRGVKLARGIALTTVARNAAHRGEHEISRNTIARGKPGCLGCTCSSYPRAFFRTRGYGRSRRPAFPAPSSQEGQRNCKTSDKSCRENENGCLAVFPGRAKRELWCALAHLRISRFRVWSFGPSRNDGDGGSAPALTRCLRP